MAKTYVLDRVATDLARGRTHPAMQRLGSLVAAHPTDLDLRRRLAAAHRRVGNRIQAGRWDYLTIGADADDTSAFERAFPSAVARLREIRWPYRAGHAATAYARARLERLVEAAEAERSRAVRATARVRRSWLFRRALAVPRPGRLPSAILAVTVPVAAFFVGLGCVTVVQWLVQ
jgi:hypothetical protein